MGTLAPDELELLKSRIKHNCNISDAKFWGSYSICGLLLRMRELFQMEMNIMPWEKIHREDISSWISEREALWQKIEEQEYTSLSIGGRIYAPFDTESINDSLRHAGLIYGAGIGIYMKPSFFLARLTETRELKKMKVFVSGKELARDLSAYPAMIQNNTIFARTEALAVLLWEKQEEMKSQPPDSALSYAFSQYGVDRGTPASEGLFDTIWGISLHELDMFLYHELGEALEEQRLGAEWKTLVAGVDSRRVEIFLRSVKDILADTCEGGMLHKIIAVENRGALGFYMSSLSGFRQMIFPHIRDAFLCFRRDGSWEHIEQARSKGYVRARTLSAQILEICGKEKDMHNITGRIEAELINPAVRPSEPAQQ